MDMTEKVLNAYSNIENPRLKSIISLLIKHLHACIKEMKPTDQEFELPGTSWNAWRRKQVLRGTNSSCWPT
jgi:hypothetical protein